MTGMQPTDVPFYDPDEDEGMVYPASPPLQARDLSTRPSPPPSNYYENIPADDSPWSVFYNTLADISDTGRLSGAPSYSAPQDPATGHLIEDHLDSMDWTSTPPNPHERADPEAGRADVLTSEEFLRRCLAEAPPPGYGRNEEDGSLRQITKEGRIKQDARPCYPAGIHLAGGIAYEHYDGRHRRNCYFPGGKREKTNPGQIKWRDDIVRARAAWGRANVSTSVSTSEENAAAAPPGYRREADGSLVPITRTGQIRKNGRRYFPDGIDRDLKPAYKYREKNSDANRDRHCSFPGGKREKANKFEISGFAPQAPRAPQYSHLENGDVESKKKGTPYTACQLPPWKGRYPVYSRTESGGIRHFYFAEDLSKRYDLSAGQVKTLRSTSGPQQPRQRPRTPDEPPRETGPEPSSSHDTGQQLHK